MCRRKQFFSLKPPTMDEPCAQGLLKEKYDLGESNHGQTGRTGDAIRSRVGPHYLTAQRGDFTASETPTMVPEQNWLGKKEKAFPVDIEARITQQKEKSAALRLSETGYIRRRGPIYTLSEVEK